MAIIWYIYVICIFKNESIIISVFKNKSFSERLENKFSYLHNIKYSICINSCTSALHVAFLALGLKKDDEVLVPALTPIMCGTSVHLAGGIPVYVDVNPNTFLIDIEDIKNLNFKAISEKSDIATWPVK